MLIFPYTHTDPPCFSFLHESNWFLGFSEKPNCLLSAENLGQILL